MLKWSVIIFCLSFFLNGPIVIYFMKKVLVDAKGLLLVGRTNEEVKRSVNLSVCFVMILAVVGLVILVA